MTTPGHPAPESRYRNPGTPLPHADVSWPDGPPLLSRLFTGGVHYLLVTVSMGDDGRLRLEYMPEAEYARTHPGWRRP